MYILTTREENNGIAQVTKYYNAYYGMFVADAKDATHLDLDEAMSIQETYKERGYPVQRELVDNIL